MFHRVRQRLLDEPEDGELDAGRRVGAVAGAFVPDGQAGGPDPAEETVQVGQARQRLAECLP
jgi:hypothetical protein